MNNRLYVLLTLALSSYLFAEIELYSNKSSYLVGEHIEVYFSDLNSVGSDWIGIFQSGSLDEEFLYWQFTDGTQYNYYNFIDSGYIYFSPVSLPAGEYEIRLFYNNSYQMESSNQFIIADSCLEIPESDFEDTARSLELAWTEH